MDKKKLSIEELFEQQSVTAKLFTLEPDKENEEKVKLTPWSEESGCNCHSSLVIDKNLIDSVIPSGHVHKCCGKRLMVVEIVFKKNSSMTLDEIFEQLFKEAITDSHEHHVHNTNYQNEQQNMDMGSYYPETGEYINDTGLNEQDSQSNFDKSFQDFEKGYYQQQSCPSGTVNIACAGRFHCVRPGSSCCHMMVCPPGTRCFQCAGRFHCVRPGSSCCHNMVCPPGTSCRQGGGRFYCG